MVLAAVWIHTLLPAYFLLVSREYRKIVYGGYIGIIFLYSLLRRTSKPMCPAYVSHSSCQKTIPTCTGSKRRYYDLVVVVRRGRSRRSSRRRRRRSSSSSSRSSSSSNMAAVVVPPTSISGRGLFCTLEPRILAKKHQCILEPDVRAVESY